MSQNQNGNKGQVKFGLEQLQALAASDQVSPELRAALSLAARAAGDKRLADRVAATMERETFAVHAVPPREYQDAKGKTRKAPGLVAVFGPGFRSQGWRDKDTGAICGGLSPRLVLAMLDHADDVRAACDRAIELDEHEAAVTA